ncbi:Uncharacterised protein [uncultured archaeon]|nr:Uncharacterised protein [uncultured archaeon]
MCLQCLSINKNKDKQLHDSTEGKNKDVDSKEYEQVLNKT